MRKVTTFTEFKSKKMLALLGEVEEMVRSGEATGLLVSVKRGELHHGVGLVGEYLDDPAPVLTVLSRVEYRINQLMDARLRRPRPRGGTVHDIGDKKK